MITIVLKTSTLTKSITFRWPYEKAIAFGGVATGNINAREDARTGGIIK